MRHISLEGLDTAEASEESDGNETIHIHVAAEIQVSHEVVNAEVVLNL